MRVGVLCTFKYFDIRGNKLCIRRTEVRHRGEDGKYVFEVREPPNMEAGNRIKEKAFSVKIVLVSRNGLCIKQGKYMQ